MNTGHLTEGSVTGLSSPRIRPVCLLHFGPFPSLSCCVFTSCPWLQFCLGPPQVTALSLGVITVDECADLKLDCLFPISSLVLTPFSFSLSVQHVHHLKRGYDQQFCPGLLQFCPRLLRFLFLFFDIQAPEKLSSPYHQLVWEVLLFMCGYYWVMSKAVLVNDSVE